MEKVRILIVEDEVIVAMDLQSTLEGWGYTVPATASSGEVALQKAAELRPDLVLMDIVLKGEVDGIEAAAQIRDRFDIPVIFVTAYADEERLGRAKITEPFGYILKPFDERELHTNIQMALYRHQMEKKLREAELRYRTVADFTHDWEYWIGVDGNHIYVSPSCERVTGYHAEEFLGDAGLLKEITHPDDRAPVVRHLREALESQAMLSIDFRILTRDGKERWIGHVCQPVYGDNGRYLGRRASNRDITERVRMEQALRLSKSRLETLWQLSQMTEASLEQMADFVLEQAVRLTKSRVGFLGFVNEDETVMTMHAWSKEAVEQCSVADRPLHFSLGEAGLLGGAVRQRRPIIINDYSAPHPSKKGYPEGHVPLSRFMSVPVFEEGRIVAVAAVGNKGEEYSEPDVLQLTLLMDGMWRLYQRKRAEEALKATQEYTRSIIESSLDMIIAVDMKRHIVEFNKAAQRTFGYRPEEVLGAHVDMLYANPQEALQVHRTTVEAGQCVQEIHNRRKDGKVFPCFLSSSVLRDAQGELVGVMGVSRDISERVRAEEALQLLSSAVEQSSEGIAVADLGGHLLYVNDAFAAMHGYTPEEVMGQHLSIFHTPEQMPSVEAANQQIQETGQFSGEIWHARRDGTVFPGLMHNSLLWDAEANRPIGMIGTLRDISDLKQTEDALRRRNRELALLNRASQALSSTLDLDQVLAIILEEVRHLLGVVASSIWLFDPQTDDLSQALPRELVCWQAIGPQSEIVRGWRLAPGEGLVGWVAQSGENLIVPDVQADERHFKGVDQQTGLALRSILSVPLRALARGVKESVIGVLQVVDATVGRFSPADLELLEPLTTAAAMAIENARLYEQTRRDVEIKSALLREVNHRVKNNLSAIIGLLYTEQRYIELKDQTIYQSIMQNLINRVHGLSTVHSMLSASEWAPLRLSDLAARVIHSSLQMLPRDKRISIDVPLSPVRVTPDQAHNLALVINELATNTVKHSLQERDTAQISVRSTLDDDTVLFEFRDDGPGYPKEVLQLERHNVGFDLIQSIVRDGLRGELTLRNDPGAVTLVQFKLQVAPHETESWVWKRKA